MKSFYTNQCCLTVLATKTDSVANENFDFIYCRYCKNGPAKKSKNFLEFIVLKSTLLPKVRVLSNFAFLPKNHFVYENFEKLEKSSFITVAM